jgi:exopolysaccharide production protein ExoZ
LGVQLFFVISGIVIFRAHREDFNQPRKAGLFYWKRFRRIYPLYWICLTLTLLKHSASTDPAASYQHLPSVIASSYLLVHLFSYQTIMVQAWTLFDEIQFYLLFSLCILNRKIGLTAICIWLAASLVVLGSSNPYWAVIFSPYHLLFGLGILAALALDAEKQLPPRLILWSGVVVFVAAIVIAGPFDNGEAVRLIGGAGAAGIVLGAAFIERSGTLNIPRWLTGLGNASYSIYLVHFMVISAVARFSYSHLRQLPIPIGGWMLLLILSGISAGIVSHYAIERPLLGLLGKKSSSPPNSTSPSPAHP